jgi:hypothetical protein
MMEIFFRVIFMVEENLLEKTEISTMEIGKRIK